MRVLVSMAVRLIAVPVRMFMLVGMFVIVRVRMLVCVFLSHFSLPPCVDGLMRYPSYNLVL